MWIFTEKLWTSQKELNWDKVRNHFNCELRVFNILWTSCSLFLWTVFNIFMNFEEPNGRKKQRYRSARRCSRLKITRHKALIHSKKWFIWRLHFCSLRNKNVSSDTWQKRKKMKKMPVLEPVFLLKHSSFQVLNSTEFTRTEIMNLKLKQSEKLKFLFQLNGAKFFAY